MAITETIQMQVKNLPPSFRAEVLDFVEYLSAKARDGEQKECANLSLSLAMRGMEDEATPLYTAADLKEVFA